MHINSNEIPEFIQHYKAQILATKKSAIALNLTPADDLTLWQSKVGGEPYFPLSRDYPYNAEGRALVLLAQINFAELPENDFYPKTGILQFFIDIEDDLWGLDFDEPQNQNNFRVIFHEQVIQDTTQLLHTFPIQSLDQDMNPVTGQYAVQFQAQERYISISDYRFAEQICDLYEMDDDAAEDLYDAYEDAFSASGHHLGGYPYFTQDDPRGNDERFKDYILLFQLDSSGQENVEILWGDCGVANFFIHPDDLKKSDFSKVMYNWDCS
ncbi:YwqG family protein [Acinetobacter piscicola]|uniref:YwqG family protein n=1 Tax=Acinetobacter piscicola TaxID=2006115 RepID=UPI0035588D43